MKHTAPRAGKLVSLTSDIVTAQVANNRVGVCDIAALIDKVYLALAGLGQATSEEEQRPEPAVSIRASLKREYLVCLECGKKAKLLKRHLGSEHGLTPDDYRRRWDLPADYPVIAPAYAERRSELARELGLGRKPGQRIGSRK